MAIDSHYIPAFSIEDVLLDKDTGAPLSGGLVYFEHDNQRGVLKPVYQITGTSPNYTYTQLPNPMTLSSIGTFEDALGNPVIPYFYPYDANLDPDYYYVRVTSSADVPQFDREAVPYISTNDPGEVLSVITNELSNPQFAEVNFDTSTSNYVFNFSAVTDQVINIAPGWDFIVSCPSSGTLTVSQLTPAGSLNLPTNPSTLLQIASTGLSKLQLRQRLYGSPNLWGSGYIAGTFVAKTYSGTPAVLTMYYSQSGGAVIDQEIVTAELDSSGVYAAYPGSSGYIPSSSNPDTFPDAYVDIYFEIPLSIQIDLTSVMIAYTGQTSINNIEYDQESQARQIDHLFNYYEVPLSYKPIPSLMTAWDFPLNPAQFSGTSVTMTTTAQYIWDQTICKSLVGNIAVARNSVTGGFQATTANAAEAYYQMQYMSGREAKSFVGTQLCVNINAYRTQAGGDVTVKVYICRGSSSATFPTLPTSLGTINAAGDFTLTAANWTVIPRSNLGQASAVLPVVNTSDYTTLNDLVDIEFTGWQIVDSAQIANTDKVAVIVTYSCPTTATVVVTNSIGVMQGSIPTRPAPQSFDEVLSECQYYYEKSYATGVTAGTSSAANALTVQMDGQMFYDIYQSVGTVQYMYTGMKAPNFGFQFNTVKRTVPVVTIFSETGGINTVLSRIWNNGTAVVNTNQNISLWNSTIGEKAARFLVATPDNRLYQNLQSTVPASIVNSMLNGYLSYHFVADARLGIVA